MQPSDPIKKALMIALLVGGCVRLAFLILFSSNLQADPDAYRQISENVATMGVFGQSFGDGPIQPTAFRPPLYPLILSGFVVNQNLSLTLVAGFHFLLGLGTIYFGFVFARCVGIKPLGCAGVAILVAVDPILLQQSSLVMTETFATFLATACLAYSTQIFQATFTTRHFFVLGILAGVSSLCRPTFVIWGGLLLSSIVISAIFSNFNFTRRFSRWFFSETDRTQPPVQSHPLRQRLIQATWFGIAILLVLSPWMLRNHLEIGKPIFATTHGGYTLYLGNNDCFYDYLKTEQTEAWNGEAELRNVVLNIRTESQKPDGTVDELKKDQLYYRRSIATIQRRPTMFLYSTWVRIVRFWSVMPSNASANESKLKWAIQMGSAVWYATLFLAAGTGLLAILFASQKKPFRNVLFGSATMVMAFQGLHLVYWSNMRMRAPLTAIIAVLAIVGIQVLLSCVQRRRISQASSA